MSDSDNPFGKPPAPTPVEAPRPQLGAVDLGAQNNPPSKTPWVLCGILAFALLIVTGLWLTARGQVNTMQKDADDNAAKLAALAGELNTSRDLIANLQDQIATLQREKEQVGQQAKSLEGEMRAALESKDVTISKLQGKLTVSILDRLLFDSGEAALRPEGVALLQKVATLLAQHPELKIHVIGHTDNVPIRTKYASNWELSTARALAAVRFLTERAGVSPQRVGAVGYGEFRPVADNATAEGRAKNRRIAIVILPDELAGLDVANPVSPVSPPPTQ